MLTCPWTQRRTHQLFSVPRHGNARTIHELPQAPLREILLFFLYPLKWKYRINPFKNDSVWLKNEYFNSVTTISPEWMISTEALPCRSILGWLVATEQRTAETVTELSVRKLADSAGKPGLDVTLPSIITAKDQPSCTMGQALVKYCLSASINLKSPHKNIWAIRESWTDLNWHTLLIKEVTMRPVTSSQSFVSVQGHWVLLKHHLLLIFVYLGLLPSGKFTRKYNLKATAELSI